MPAPSARAAHRSARSSRGARPRRHAPACAIARSRPKLDRGCVALTLRTTPSKVNASSTSIPRTRSRSLPSPSVEKKQKRNPKNLAKVDRKGNSTSATGVAPPHTGMQSLGEAANELQARAADWWRQKRYEARACAAPCVAPCGAAREPRVVRVRDEPEGADAACLGPLRACVCAALQFRRPGVRFHHAANCDNHSLLAALADHHCWRRI